MTNSVLFCIGLSAALSQRLRGATVARPTPDRKVACSNHVGVITVMLYYLFYHNFFFIISPHRYATILAFDVKIERDAQDLADNLGVKIFQADIIYHLFDKFMAYRDELKKAKREEFKSIAVFPCKLKVSILTINSSLIKPKYYNYFVGHLFVTRSQKFSFMNGTKFSIYLFFI